MPEVIRFVVNFNHKRNYLVVNFAVKLFLGLTRPWRLEMVLGKELVAYEFERSVGRF